MDSADPKFDRAGPSNCEMSSGPDLGAVVPSVVTSLGTSYEQLQGQFENK